MTREKNKNEITWTMDEMKTDVDAYFEEYTEELEKMHDGKNPLCDSVWLDEIRDWIVGKDKWFTEEEESFFEAAVKNAWLSA